MAILVQFLTGAAKLKEGGILKQLDRKRLSTSEKFPG